MTPTREAAMEAALNDCIAAIEHADMADGVCCCGDNMENHSEPMNCGHSPVDAGEYHAHQVLTAARAAISTPATEAQGLAHIVDYTNWRGETARRVIRPIRMWWGKTEWHPEEQWMLTAWDCEKDAIRDFAWQDMRPVQNPATSAAARPAPQHAADTRVVVKPLVWEHLGNSYRAPGLLFGYIRIENYGNGFEVLWSAPGICANLARGNFATLELAQAAAQEHYTAAILSAIIGTTTPSDKIADAARDVTPQEAAQILYDTMTTNRPIFDAMVEAAEDIELTGVSFNRVVGDALRAAIARKAPDATALAGQGETP